MEDEKVLLKISTDGDTTCVSLHTDSEHDVTAIALAIDDLVKKTPVLGKALLAVRVARMIDEDLDRKIDNDSVKIPDFNKILKDLN